MSGQLSIIRRLVAVGASLALVMGASTTASQAKVKVYPSWLPSPTSDSPSVGVHAVTGGATASPRAMTQAASRPPIWPTPQSVTITQSGSARTIVRLGRAPLRFARTGTLTSGKLGIGKAQATANKLAVAARPGTVKVTIVSHAAGVKAGIDGVAWSMKRVGTTTPSTAALSVGLDYSRFADAYGGDYASRLRLVELPACALTTPAKAACRTQTPVAASANDVQHKRLVADVALPAAPEQSAATTRVATAATSTPAVVLAATSGPNGGGGDYRATSLSPSGSWSVGNTGAFTYSYPITVPPSVGGAAPSVSLNYNSASVDGRTSATNAQASWVGDGWDYSPGFIERSYKSCTDDGATDTGDECWAGDNATISLNGASSRLVPTTNGGTQWRMQSDDGSIIDEVTVASTSAYFNGLNAGTYWRLTTNTGVQYFFGADHLPASAGGNGTDTSTNAAWGMPVFGNGSGEPCHASTFNASYCTQGWRWNLDFVLDPHHNVTAYHYTSETNYYESGSGTTASAHTLRSYTRGGNVTSITYGQQAADYAAKTTPAAEIDFTTTGRCDGASGFSCATAITSANASHFPDVPFDQNCASSGTCTNYSPTFWTTKALSKISTKVWDESLTTPAWSTVDTYAMTAPSFPSPGDAGQSGGAAKAALWLSGITHTGSDTRGGGSAITTSPVTFVGSPLPNRVQGLNIDDVPPINRFRLSTITTETGATIVATYDTEATCSRDTPPAEDNDTALCYPQRWTPVDRNTPILDWFYTYPVIEVDQNDNHTVWGGSASPSHITNYSYAGAAWHRDDSEYTPTDQRSWNQFEGYRHVTTTTGGGSDPITQTVTDYLQGMDGDHLSDGTTRSVSVTTHENDSITDKAEWAGMAYQATTYSAAGGTEQVEQINTPWSSSGTASQSRTGLPDLVAHYTGTATTDTRSLLANGQWRTARVNTTYDTATGLPTRVDDLGQVDSNGFPTGTTTPEKCTTTSYASDSSRNMRNYPDQVITEAGACQSSNDAHTLSATKTLYDSGAFGTVTGAGNPTTVQRFKTASPATWTTAATAVFDPFGRVQSATDPMGRTSSTSYGTTTTTKKYLPVTITATNPAGWTSTTTFDPGRQLPTSSTDVNGNLTSQTYDGLGRLTQVWLPNHTKASFASLPSMKYAYQVTKSTFVAITSSTLVDGNAYKLDITIDDALLQQRQEQTTTADWDTSGRLISNTGYDSHGWAISNDAAFYNNDSAPSTTPDTVDYSEDIPSETRTTYDGRGRALASALWSNGEYDWKTTTSYPGNDQTNITPPTGGVATTSVTDARGQQISLEQDPDGPNDNITYYGYDGVGRQTSVIGPLAPNASATGSPLTWTTSYDALGNTVRAIDPDAGTTTNTYDDDSELTSTTTVGNEPGATTRTITYDHSDPLGRVVAEHAGSSTGPKIASFTFDTATGGKGLPASSTEYDATGLTATYTSTVTGYTNLGSPTTTTISIPAGIYGASSPAISYKTTDSYTTVSGLLYDQIIQETGAGSLMPNEEYSIAHNASGLPTATGGIKPYVTSSIYDHQGRLVRAVMGVIPDQMAITNSWDNATGRLRNSTVNKEDGTVAVDDSNYTYNDAGQVTSIRDTQGTTGSVLDQQCFRYDSLDRLTDAWTDGGDTAGNQADGAVGHCSTTDPATAGTSYASPEPYWQSYTYDLTGNRVSSTDHAVTPGATTTSTSETYTGTGDVHALRTVTTGTTVSTADYDGGNPTGQTTKVDDVPDPTQTIAYQWNAQDKLASLTQGAAGNPTHTTAYDYDPAGDLVATSATTGSTTTTTLLLGNDTITLTNGTPSRVQREYGFPGGPTAIRTGSTDTKATASDAVHYQAADPHDTALTDISADTLTVARTAYTPFGQTRGTPDTTFSTVGTRGFLNAPVDATSGLTTLGARQYNPSTGRFISVDPLLDYSDPQSMNGYAYADNDPVNSSDPSGEMLQGPSAPTCNYNDCSSTHYSDDCHYQCQVDGDYSLQLAGYVTGQRSDPGSYGAWNHYWNNYDSGGCGLCLKQAVTSIKNTVSYAAHHPIQFAKAASGYNDITGCIQHPGARCIMAAVDVALTVTAVGRAGKAAIDAKAAESAAAAATTADSALARASSAANAAADNVEAWSVSAKHLPGTGGRYNKWAYGVDINDTVERVLRSQGASFMPNVGNDSRFIVREDVGTVVGTRGQTSVKVVVGYDGNVITAYPVK